MVLVAELGGCSRHRCGGIGGSGDGVSGGGCDRVWSRKNSGSTVLVWTMAAAAVIRSEQQGSSLKA